jgi:hypothetical protein
VKNMPRKSGAVSMEKTAKTVKKLPASEHGYGVLCIAKDGAKYQISQNPDKKTHTLWKIIPGGYEKVANADSPYPLYEMIDWG